MALHSELVWDSSFGVIGCGVQGELIRGVCDLGNFVYAYDTAALGCLCV